MMIWLYACYMSICCYMSTFTDDCSVYDWWRQNDAAVNGSKWIIIFLNSVSREIFWMENRADAILIYLSSNNYVLTNKLLCWLIYMLFRTSCYKYLQLGYLMYFFNFTNHCRYHYKVILLCASIPVLVNYLLLIVVGIYDMLDNWWIWISGWWNVVVLITTIWR